MSHKCFKLLPTVLLLSLMVSCHPEGCYGPESFGYNTKGVAVSNLFGTYIFDGTNPSALNKKGFTNHSGSIQLKPDMTFVFSEVPFIMHVPKSGVYVSTTGKWKAVRNQAIWEVEVYDVDFKSMGGYSSLTFPILGEHPPHGIELAINHDEGYYIRYRRRKPNASSGAFTPHVDQKISSSKYPVAADLKKVGTYPMVTKSGAGYFYDDVLEYRVWVNSTNGGGDHFKAFATYEQAEQFSKSTTGAEKPLVLIRQLEHVNEPKKGVYEHVKGERITEWVPEWLDGSRRAEDSIPKFLSNPQPMRTTEDK